MENKIFSINVKNLKPNERYIYIKDFFKIDMNKNYMDIIIIDRQLYQKENYVFDIYKNFLEKKILYQTLEYFIRNILIFDDKLILHNTPDKPHKNIDIPLIRNIKYKDVVYKGLGIKDISGIYLPDDLYINLFNPKDIDKLIFYEKTKYLDDKYFEKSEVSDEKTHLQYFQNNDLVTSIRNKLILDTNIYDIYTDMAVKWESFQPYNRKIYYDIIATSGDIFKPENSMMNQLTLNDFYFLLIRIFDSNIFIDFDKIEEKFEDVVIILEYLKKINSFFLNFINEKNDKVLSENIKKIDNEIKIISIGVWILKKLINVELQINMNHPIITGFESSDIAKKNIIEYKKELASAIIEHLYEKENDKLKSIANFKLKNIILWIYNQTKKIHEERRLKSYQEAHNIKKNIYPGLHSKELPIYIFANSDIINNMNRIENINPVDRKTIGFDKNEYDQNKTIFFETIKTSPILYRGESSDTQKLISKNIMIPKHQKKTQEYPKSWSIKWSILIKKNLDKFNINKYSKTISNIKNIGFLDNIYRHRVETQDPSSNLAEFKEFQRFYKTLILSEWFYTRGRPFKKNIDTFQEFYNYSGTNKKKIIEVLKFVKRKNIEFKIFFDKTLAEIQKEKEDELIRKQLRFKAYFDLTPDQKLSIDRISNKESRIKRLNRLVKYNQLSGKSEISEEDDPESIDFEPEAYFVEDNF